MFDIDEFCGSISEKRLLFSVFSFCGFGRGLGGSDASHGGVLRRLSLPEMTG